MAVTVDHRPCPHGWAVIVTAEGTAPRELQAADEDEVDHLLQYELDVIMSLTGCDLITSHTLYGQPWPPTEPCPGRP